VSWLAGHVAEDGAKDLVSRQMWPTLGAIDSVGLADAVYSRACDLTHEHASSQRGSVLRDATVTLR